jgi:hypothetical protein
MSDDRRGAAPATQEEPRRPKFGNLVVSNASRETRHQMHFWNSAEWAMNPGVPRGEPHPSPEVLESRLGVELGDSVLTD